MTTKPLFYINRQPDGSWTIAPQPPLPSITTLINGWADVAKYRDQWDALDCFHKLADYYKFCKQFGEPPFERDSSGE
jgi:hypothetical protein